MTITVTTFSKPTMQLFLEAGGSHTASTTRYYTLCFLDNTTASNYTYQSPWADEASVTFDSTNKSVVIAWSDPSGLPSNSGVRIFRTNTSGDYFGTDGANSFTLTDLTILSNTDRTKTTVDQDSSSGTSTLYVASTTGFVANDYIVIDFDNTGGGTEVAKISSISAGVSFSLDRNLANTHTAAQADAVWIAEQDDNAA